MSKNKLKSKPKELILAKQLIDECKLDEAYASLNNFIEKEGIIHRNKVLSLLLQCQILFLQGKYEKLLKHTEQTFKESEILETSFLKIDCLILMVHALVRYKQFDKAIDMIKQGEDIVKTFPKKLSNAHKRRIASLAYIKGFSFYRKVKSPNDANLALEYLEKSLLLREELGIKHEISESYYTIAYNLCRFKGDQNRALKYAERGLAFAKESTKKLYIAGSLFVMGWIYDLKGDLDRSIGYYEQCLTIFKELNNKTRIAHVFNNLSNTYKMRGELTHALEYIEQAMVINRDLGRLKALAINHDALIQILIDKGNLTRAKNSLQKLEQLNIKLKEKYVNLTYLFDKALVLKTSLRARDRGKAEEILTHLLEDENLFLENRLRVLLNLGELLLTELRMTNDLEVLDELNKYIGQLLEIAEKSKSYWILSEVHLLQSKLSLLTFDIKKAQRYLTQARQIAERFGLNQLSVKIDNENEDLLTKLDLWQKLKEEDALMADRMELARLDEKIVKMIQKYPVLTAQLTEEKVVISKEMKICLVCRDEVSGFSYNCKCGANYCENCARALVDLENVCWACDEPIDYSKPVKHFKEETEHAKGQEKAKKK
jgi:tetratricopeptide (TPR) repeat protein